MEEAGPTGSLDPVHGVPQEEVAGGGVGLGRSVAVGRSRFVDSPLPSGWEEEEPVVHPKGRPGRRGAPALRDRAATGWDGVLWEVSSVFRHCLPICSGWASSCAPFPATWPTSPQAKVCSLASNLPFPTQPQQLSLVF